MLLFLKFKTLFVTWGNVGVGVEGSRGSGRELLNSCRGSFFTKVFKPPFLPCFYLQALQCRGGFIIPVFNPFFVSHFFYTCGGSGRGEVVGGGGGGEEMISRGGGGLDNMKEVSQVNLAKEVKEVTTQSNEGQKKLLLM